MYTVESYDDTINLQQLNIDRSLLENYTNYETYH